MCYISKIKSCYVGSIIEFAYTSFKWGNSAANNAGVTVSIVGLATSANVNELRKLFDEELGQQLVDNINPYLTYGPNVIVETTNKAIREPLKTPVEHLERQIFL